MARVSRKRGLVSSAPDDTDIVVGIGWIAADSRIVLATSAATARLFRRIASMARRQQLVPLFGMKLLRVSQSGVIRARYDEPSLWVDLPAPTFRGSLEKTTTLIRRAAPEAPMWFWLTERAQTGQPHLIFSPRPLTDDTSPFARSIAAMRGEGVELTGTVRVGDDGQMVMVSSSDALKPALDAVLDAHASRLPGLERLRGARLVTLPAAQA